MSEDITIVIADDHPIFRLGLCDVLRIVPELNVVGEASDGAAALELIRTVTPRVAVIDIDMPVMSGLELAERVKREDLPVFLLVLTMHQEESIFNRAMDLGVLGYLVKDSVEDELVNAVRRVAGGEYFVSPTLLARAAQKKRQVPESDTARNVAALTVMEKRVLRTIAQSRTTRQIADALSISPRTVDRHRYNMCQKLRLSGSYSLLRFAFNHLDLLDESE